MGRSSVAWPFMARRSAPSVRLLCPVHCPEQPATFRTPSASATWRLLGWSGHLRRNRAYDAEIENIYKRPNFPMWTGFLWKPRHTPEKPVPLALLKEEVEAVHQKTRAFYTGKDEDLLGNIHAGGPAIGVVNPITGLKVWIDHDALHYDDVLKMVEAGGESENVELTER